MYGVTYLLTSVVLETVVVVVEEGRKGKGRGGNGEGMGVKGGNAV